MFDPTPVPEGFFAHTLGEFVSVSVGSGMMLFNLHEKLLAGKAANVLKLAGNGFISLPEVDPKVFDLFVYWMYNDSLPGSIDVTDPGVTATVTERIKLAMFAEHYDILSLYGCICTSFEHYFEHKDYVPSVQDIFMVYEKTEEGSALRDWIIEMFYVRLCLDTPALTLEDIKFIGSNAKLATDVLICIQGKTTPEAFSFQNIEDALQEFAEQGRGPPTSQTVKDSLVGASTPHRG